jgi:hypothetical protein
MEGGYVLEGNRHVYDPERAWKAALSMTLEFLGSDVKEAFEKI